MYNKYAKVLALCAVLLLSVSVAYGAPSGASITFGNSSQGSASSVTTIFIDSGNLTYTNVTTTAISNKWAGFFGQVSGNIQLSDSGSNIFYQWTVGNVTDVVIYAANDTISDWSIGNIEAANYTHIPAFLKSDSGDNYTNTYTTTENFNSTTFNIASTSYVVTYQTGSPGPLRTYALYSPTDTALIWAGKAIDNIAGFDNSTVDYQILVPANTSGTTYSFYLELV